MDIMYREGNRLMSQLSQNYGATGGYVFTLSELNTAIRTSVETAFPGTVRVVAEISDIRCNAKGHCYLELIEKEGEKTIAHIRANIWSYAFSGIASRFEKGTGESLKQGMKVLILANVTFHEVYGLSLNIRDIDPAYSLGEMARKRREIIERLAKEGLLRLNRAIPLPLVPQRIAVVSSVTAAGYGDFIKHIDNNPSGYKIFCTLYHSSMQGQEAEASIIGALGKIKKHRSLYDAVVIVRGGGSQIDLSCFDAYGLAVEVAKFPLPVITGIGHERDDTVVDIVAHTKLKTPTAVAEFLLSGMSNFEERVLNAEKRLIDMAKEQLGAETHRLRYLAQHFRHIVRAGFGAETKKRETLMHRLVHGTTQCLNSGDTRLKLDVSRIAGGLTMLFQRHEGRITHCLQAVRLLDPLNVLKRGYSIAYFEGKALRDSSVLRIGDNISTRVFKGTFKSRVEAINEEK